MPGQANTVSTMTAPASRLPISSAAIVTTGIAALRSTCRSTTAAARHALGAARPHVVLAELLDHRDPRHAGEGRHRQRAERDRRHDQRASVSAPEVGSQRSSRANTMISRMPAQEGRHALAGQHERPASFSTSLPRQTPATTPTGTPTPSATSERAGREPQRVGNARSRRCRRRHPLDDATCRNRGAPGRPGSRAYCTSDRPVEAELRGAAASICSREAPSGTSSRVGSPESRMTMKTIVDHAEDRDDRLDQATERHSSDMRGAASGSAAASATAATSCP